MRTVDRLIVSIAAAAVACGVAGDGIALHEARQATQLRHVLTQRCAERVEVWRTTNDNLRGDLLSLQADAAFYRAQMRDLAKLGVPALVENYRQSLASRAQNIASKRTALSTNEEHPPNCNEIK